MECVQSLHPTEGLVVELQSTMLKGCVFNSFLDFRKVTSKTARKRSYSLDCIRTDRDLENFRRKALDVLLFRREDSLRPVKQCDLYLVDDGAAEYIEKVYDGVPLMIRPPLRDEEPAFTDGSSYHQLKCCRPCLFYTQRAGCNKGRACLFCHHWHPSEYFNSDPIKLRARVPVVNAHPSRQRSVVEQISPNAEAAAVISQQVAVLSVQRHQVSDCYVRGVWVPPKEPLTAQMVADPGQLIEDAKVAARSNAQSAYRSLFYDVHHPHTTPYIPFGQQDVKVAHCQLYTDNRQQHWGENSVTKRFSYSYENGVRDIDREFSSSNSVSEYTSFRQWKSAKEISSLDRTIGTPGGDSAANLTTMSDAWQTNIGRLNTELSSVDNSDETPNDIALDSAVPASSAGIAEMTANHAPLPLHSDEWVPHPVQQRGSSTVVDGRRMSGWNPNAAVASVEPRILPTGVPTAVNPDINCNEEYATSSAAADTSGMTTVANSSRIGTDTAHGDQSLNSAKRGTQKSVGRNGRRQQQLRTKSNHLQSNRVNEESTTPKCTYGSCVPDESQDVDSAKLKQAVVVDNGLAAAGNMPGSSQGPILKAEGNGGSKRPATPGDAVNTTTPPSPSSLTGSEPRLDQQIDKEGLHFTQQRRGGFGRQNKNWHNGSFNNNNHHTQYHQQQHRPGRGGRRGRDSFRHHYPSSSTNGHFVMNRRTRPPSPPTNEAPQQRHVKM